MGESRTGGEGGGAEHEALHGRGDELHVLHTGLQGLHLHHTTQRQQDHARVRTRAK
jgi:hypothetical protein